MRFAEFFSSQWFSSYLTATQCQFLSGYAEEDEETLSVAEVSSSHWFSSYLTATQCQFLFSYAEEDVETLRFAEIFFSLFLRVSSF